MTSRQPYRSYGFIKIAERLSSDGETVTMLCSPEGARSRYLEGFDHGEMVTFEQLVGSMNTHEALRTLQETIGTYWRMREDLSEHFPGYDRWVTVNLLFLEQVKGACLSQILTPKTRVHTYSYMPYLCGVQTDNGTFWYQHGLLTHEARGWNLSTFIPTTMLLWGRSWEENFARESHRSTKFYAVGSPYFDYLRNEGHRFGDRVYDVLIIGGSHSRDLKEALPRTYETVVTDTISACTNLGYTVGIKLHHNEPIDWYETRNLEQYIVDFSDIVDAVGSSRVVVNVMSSAFVEAVAMQVPVIADESFGSYYEKMGATKCISLLDFGELQETLPEFIDGAKRGGEMTHETTEVMRLGESVDRIADITTSDETYQPR